MKQILLSILLVLFALPGWAATYYVSGTGSNTSPYDTWAKAANLPSTVVALNPAGGPHTVYIAAGTYTDAISLTDASWASSVWVGTSAHGATTAAAKGQVIITNNSAHAIRAGVSGVSMSNISATATGASKDCVYVDGANFTGDNLYLYDGSRMAINLTDGSTGFLVKNSFLAGAGSSVTYNSGNSAGEFRYCNIGNGLSRTGSSVNTQTMQFNSTGNVSVNNCNVWGGTYYAMRQTAVGTTTVNNCILEAGDNIGAGTTVTRSAGTINVNYSILVPNWRRIVSEEAASYIGDGVGDSNNIKISNPRFTRRQRSAYIVPCIDNSENVGYAATVVEPILSALGVKGTIFAQSLPADIEDYATDLVALNGRGVIEVQSHGYNHNELTELEGEALAAELTNARSSFNTYMGYQPLHIAPPFGATSESVETAIKTAGFLSSRVSTYEDWGLASFNVYRIHHVTNTLLLGATDAKTQEAVRAMCERLAQQGGIVMILSHDATEISGANWQLILNTIKNEYPEITITSASVAIAAITASPWTTADDITYTRTSWPILGDYHLQSSSPAINAGVDVGLTVDYEGTAIMSNPDIGAYEHWTYYPWKH